MNFSQRAAGACGLAEASGPAFGQHQIDCREALDGYGGFQARWRPALFDLPEMAVLGKWRRFFPPGIETWLTSPDFKNAVGMLTDRNRNWQLPNCYAELAPYGQEGAWRETIPPMLSRVFALLWQDFVALAGLSTDPLLKVFIASKIKGKSLNSWVSEVLEEAAEEQQS